MLEGSLDLKSKFEKAGGSKKVTWTVLPPPPATRNPPPSPAIYTCTRRQTRVACAHKHNPARTCGMMVVLPFGTNSDTRYRGGLSACALKYPEYPEYSD